MEDLDSCIKNRALVTLGNTIEVLEVYFMEMSPNRIYVKLEHLEGRKEWVRVDEVNIVDFLPSVQRLADIIPKAVTYCE